MKKRWISLAMAVMLLLSAFSWASAETDPDTLAAQFAYVVKDLDLEKTVDIIWYGHNTAGFIPNENASIKRTLEKLFNVRITDAQVDTFNEEQLNLMKATGMDFDVATMPVEFVEWAELGLLRPISAEDVKTYMPNLYQPLIEAVGEDWVNYATVSGQLYGIPVISQSYTNPITMGVRTDWLEAVGYSPDNLPTTLEGLEEMLVKFHTDDPDGNGQMDTYAIDIFDEQYFGEYPLGAYGVSRRYWYNDGEGKPMWYAVDENYKEALKVLQRWYKLGIFDPEIISDGNNETTAKILADKVGGYHGNDWAFSTGHDKSPVKRGAAEGKTIDITIIPPVSGPSQVPGSTQYAAPVLASGMAFGRNCSDEAMIRIMQIINATFGDKDLFRYLFMGEKDVFYTEDKEGDATVTEMKTSEAMHTHGIQRYLFFSFNPSTTYEWRTEKSRLMIARIVRDMPTVKPNLTSVFTTEAEIEYQASVDKISDSFFWKAVMGEVDVDQEWDGYVKSWLAAGGQEILDQKLKLYEEMTK